MTTSWDRAPEPPGAPHPAGRRRPGCRTSSPGRRDRGLGPVEAFLVRRVPNGERALVASDDDHRLLVDGRIEESVDDALDVIADEEHLLAVVLTLSARLSLGLGRIVAHLVEHVRLVWQQHVEQNELRPGLSIHDVELAELPEGGGPMEHVVGGSGTPRRSSSVGWKVVSSKLTSKSLPSAMTRFSSARLDVRVGANQEPMWR